MSKREAKLYLDDIIESGKKSLSYVKGFTFNEFRADSKTYDAVIRTMEVIGEAVYNMSAEVKEKY